VSRAAIRALILLLASPLPAGSAPRTVSDGRLAMGTILEVTVVTADEAEGRAVVERLFAIATRLDALLTNWDPESALMRLNRAAGQGPQRIDPELARVLGAALTLSRETDGAFDVTVGPLVTLWRTAGERGALPTDSERSRALAAVGSAKLRADPNAATAELTAGASIDLGGLAKGYALDRMREELRRAAVTSALLSFGQSSLLALGAPPDAPGWRLLVRTPEGGFAGVATLRDRAASVSGSLGQWTEIEGRRYGHVIDPRSGEPLVRAAQAMVLMDSAASAEAWSKALLVVQPQQGLDGLARAGGEGLLLEADGRSFATPSWKEATAFEPLDQSETRSSETSPPSSKPASR
jgi:thiamine biosynthesis lipoprotein